MDTQNRTLDRGRRMRVFVEEEGPIPGVQAFEWNGTVSLERNGEYDSDEQIIEEQIPEYNGFLEVLDSERFDLQRALMGLSTANLVDVDLAGFGHPPISCNVWNQRKTRFQKSSFVMRPTFSNHPYPTTLNDATRLRFEFSSPRCVKSQQYAIALDAFNGNDVATVFTLTRTAVRLSWVYGRRYVISVVLVATDTSLSSQKTYTVGDISATTASSVTLRTAPPTNTRVLVYYFYTSTGEAVGYQGSTT